MNPEIDIGPLTLQTFGLCFGIAFLAAGAIIGRRLNELGKPVDWAYEIVLVALAGGLIGSRLNWILQNWDQASDDLLGTVFSGSGLIWYGGAIGGALAVGIWAKRRGMFDLGLLDLCAAPLAAGYALGRVGCQLSGDGDYGEAWDGPWAMAYPEGVVSTTETVHPTPIYESVAMGIVAIVLWRLRDRFRPGVLFAIYLVLAGLERFLVEFVRRNDAVLAGLTQAQLLSVAMFVAGAVWIWSMRDRLRPPGPAQA